MTVEYKRDGSAVTPLRVDTVVVSAQHSNDISTGDSRKEILEKIVKQVVPTRLVDQHTISHVSENQSSMFRSPGMLTVNAISDRFNHPGGSLLVARKVMPV